MGCVYARRMQRSKEMQIAVAIQRVQHKVGMQCGNFLHRSNHIAFPQRQIAFAEQLSALRTQQVLDDQVRGARKDVIRTDQVKTLALVLQRP